MHFKQFQDDLVEKHGTNRCGDLLKTYLFKDFVIVKHCVSEVFNPFASTGRTGTSNSFTLKSADRRTGTSNEISVS